jgi:hypothetical protein
MGKNGLGSQEKRSLVYLQLKTYHMHIILLKIGEGKIKFGLALKKSPSPPPPADPQEAPGVANRVKVPPAARFTHTPNRNVISA